MFGEPCDCDCCLRRRGLIRCPECNKPTSRGMARPDEWFSLCFSCRLGKAMADVYKGIRKGAPSKAQGREKGRG